jgi:membrane protein
MSYALRNFIVRTSHAVSYYLQGVYLRLREEELLFMASGIAFNCILCLIPLLLLLTSVLGIVLNSSDIASRKIEEILSTAFPPQPYAQNIKASISQVIGDIIHYRTSFGLFAVVILIWTATSLFSATRSVLNRVYRKKSSKLMVHTILEDILWVIVVGMLFLVTVGALWVSSFIESLVKELFPRQAIDVGNVSKLLPTGASFLLTLVMFYIVYRFIPDKGISNACAWISTFTTTVLWVVAGKFFGWYLSTFQSFSRLYGAYAFLLVLLVWIYYSSIIFILGGLVGQLFREKHNL